MGSLPILNNCAIVDHGANWLSRPTVVINIFNLYSMLAEFLLKSSKYHLIPISFSVKIPTFNHADERLKNCQISSLKFTFRMIGNTRSSRLLWHSTRTYRCLTLNNVPLLSKCITTCPFSAVKLLSDLPKC